MIDAAVLANYVRMVTQPADQFHIISVCGHMIGKCVVTAGLVFLREADKNRRFPCAPDSMPRVYVFGRSQKGLSEAWAIGPKTPAYRGAPS